MDFLEILEPLIEAIALGVDLFGVTLILIGAAKFAVRAAALEVQRIRGLACVHRIRHNRMELGGYILAALEFMIVSDILHTVVSRDLESLYFLGLLVVIRTAISHFLGVELKEVEAAERKELAAHQDA